MIVTTYNGKVVKLSEEEPRLGSNGWRYRDCVISHLDIEIHRVPDSDLPPRPIEGRYTFNGNTFAPVPKTATERARETIAAQRSAQREATGVKVRDLVSVTTTDSPFRVLIHALQVALGNDNLAKNRLRKELDALIREYPL